MSSLPGNRLPTVNQLPHVERITGPGIDPRIRRFSEQVIAYIQAQATYIQCGRLASGQNDPAAPPRGQAIIWVSTGVGDGANGDGMVTVTDTNGNNNTGLLWDFSNLSTSATS